MSFVCARLQRDYGFEVCNRAYIYILGVLYEHATCNQKISTGHTPQHIPLP